MANPAISQPRAVPPVAWQTGLRALAVLLLGLMIAVVVAPAATAQSVTNDDMCDLTPTDGNWSLGPGLVDDDLTVLSIENHEVSVPDALVGCSNLYQYFDGTWVYVGVYLMASEEAAQAALDDLRSDAAAKVPVTAFATPALGDDTWIADFEFHQVAFTRVGRYLIGAHSIESYDYSRADYNQIIIERMGVIVANVTEQGGGSEPTGTTATNAPGGTNRPGVSTTVPRRSGGGGDDSEGVPPAVLVGGAAAAAAAGAALQRSRARRRRGGEGPELPQEPPEASQPEEPDDEDEDEDQRVVLELTYPAGRSPNVFQFGWVFGARCIVNPGKPDQRDVSDSVRWSGEAQFFPPTGRISRPHFLFNGDRHTMPSGVHFRSITLTVDVDGETTEKTFPMSVVRTVGYAAITHISKVPADAHGCPACPHACVGPIFKGSPNVFLSGLPAARVGDMGVHAACCDGNIYWIEEGDPSVLIDGKPAARKGDRTRHCGGNGKIIHGHNGGY